MKFSVWYLRSFTNTAPNLTTMIHMSYRIAAYLLLIFATASSAATQERPERCPDGDAYAVYSTVLDLFRQVARTAYLVESTARPMEIRFGSVDLVTDAIRRIPEVTPAFRRHLESVTSEEWELQSDKFSAALPVSLISEVEVATFTNEALDWSGYPKSYPAAGLVSFSPVVFSVDRAEALVTVVFHCGGRCGHIDVEYLRQSGGSWRRVGGAQVLVM